MKYAYKTYEYIFSRMDSILRNACTINLIHTRLTSFSMIADSSLDYIFSPYEVFFANYNSVTYNPQESSPGRHVLRLES